MTKHIGFYRFLASDLGFPLSRVIRWHQRDSVPAKYWPRLIEVAERRFDVIITARQLMLAAADECAPVSEAADRSTEAA